MVLVTLILQNWQVLMHYGFLEHRTAKARYPRTDRKEFVRQMTQIERCQAHIRRIRARNLASNKTETETVDRDPEVHHRIAKSQNQPEHLGQFVQKHSGDPAVKVRAVTMWKLVTNAFCRTLSQS